MLVPLHVIASSQGVPPGALHWLLALGRSVLIVTVLTFALSSSRVQLWIRELRRG